MSCNISILSAFVCFKTIVLFIEFSFEFINNSDIKIIRDKVFVLGQRERERESPLIVIL